MEGGSLADLIHRSGQLSADVATDLLRPVADALDAAHHAGLVHRDVKPSNVLLQEGRAFLADFGLAMTSSAGTSVDGEEAGMSGTVGYLAPEQIEGDRASAASDQYALACVLVECLTGRPPFERANDLAVIYAHLQEPAPSVSATRPDLPKTVDAVLARGLAKEPADRYASCRDLVEAFGDADEPSSPVCCSSRSTVPAPRRARHWRPATASRSWTPPRTG